MLDKENYRAFTALEIAVGRKLYQVVVEDEKTGADLLKHGQIKKHVTLIPLNKANAFTISAQAWLSLYFALVFVTTPVLRKLQAAQRLPPIKVQPALSFVGYAEDVARAIAYVLSDTHLRRREFRKACQF